MKRMGAPSCLDNGCFLADSSAIDNKDDNSEKGVKKRCYIYFKQ